MTLVRTMVDPRDDNDIATVHKLQDAIGVEQKKVGTFEVPDWDQETLAIVRDTLKRVAPAVGHQGGFGPRGQVDPIRYLIATATGWGGNPPSDATYVGAFPRQNDGKTVHTLTVGQVPVDGFWSVSVYNANGFFEKNDDDAYTVNNLTANRNDDGTVTVRFGGDAEGVANHIPITPGWNYVVRLYRPRAEILDGSWSFPEATPTT
jgi:hypothetical protein